MILEESAIIDNRCDNIAKSMSQVRNAPANFFAGYR